MFFIKQKTAYEMRISDWSSDVCSSDLHDAMRRRPAAHGADLHRRCVRPQHDLLAILATLRQVERVLHLPRRMLGRHVQCSEIVEVVLDKIGRAALGKECVSTCRSRWSPYH